MWAHSPSSTLLSALVGVVLCSCRVPSCSHTMLTTFDEQLQKSVVGDMFTVNRVLTYFVLAFVKKNILSCFSHNYQLRTLSMIVNCNVTVLLFWTYFGKRK